MEKWALAMEGGSLRCMFSAGAVDVMMERQLWANGVFGVSAGALTGVNYVSRQVGRTAQVNLDFVNDKRYLGLGNLIFKKSIFNFDFLFGEISDSLLPLDREGFARSEMEFTAVTTDCRTGQPAYWEKHRCGDIYGAIRASASMPLLSPTFWMVTIVSVIHAFKTYNEVYAMFSRESAGPGNSAITMVYYIYDMFFNRGQVHYASAAAIIFLAIVLALTVIQKWVSKRFVYYV